MYFKLCLLLITLCAVIWAAKIDPKSLRCLVCRTTIKEFEIALKKVDPRKTVEVGNYRLDPSGNTHQKRIPMSKSEVHMSDMLDEVCKKLNDYVRVTYKSTGKLDVMELMSDAGMNPDLSMVDFITDSDLNKSLEFYCEGVLEENEEAIVKLYAAREDDDHMPNGLQAICFKFSKLCEDWMLPTDEDRDWNTDKEKEYREVYGDDRYGFNRAPPENPDLPYLGGGDEGSDDRDEL